MKKAAFALLLVCLLTLCACACAQTFTFDDIAATLSIDDSYILLTPDNLAQHPEWVASEGSTPETLAAQWRTDGILLVADSSDGVTRFVLTAVQDDDAEQYYDLDQQATACRSTFRKQHLKGTAYKADGYTYQSAEWKKFSANGRFLTLKYKRTTDGGTYRGYAYRTVRNGYTITLDYQVYGRSLKTADSNALSKIMSGFAFTSIAIKPDTAVGKVTFTSTPPSETNTGSFTVSGTGTAGLKVIGVMMRMSSNDRILVEDTINKSGEFDLKMSLPSEGVWLMTVTVENGSTVTQEEVFETTTYQSTLLPVNLDEEVPAQLSSDKLVISGKTIQGVTVQCIVNDTYYDKLVRTNNNGTFSFKIDTSEEGDYNITLTFQKKNYDTRRYTFTANRTLTEADLKAQYIEEAIKPAYSTLTKKLTGYTGRIMKYKLYAVKIAQEGERWIITMAMDKTKSGAYKNFVVVTTTQEPNFSMDSQQTMYGRCTGAYETTDGEKTVSYPGFELLFWD